MDLRTTWLGLELPHPLVIGASPLVDHPDLVKRAVDAGAAAIVMHSLFEEQVAADQWAAHRWMDHPADSSAEASGYFPATQAAFGPRAWLDQLRRVRATADVPIVASLNGYTTGGWTSYAWDMQEAGATALELNLYRVEVDLQRSSAEIEDEVVRLVAAVCSHVRIPVSVKLSPQWAGLPHLATRLEHAGAKGLTLFNRSFFPDIDPETLDVTRRLKLSTSAELPGRLHAIGLLSGRTRLSLALTGGVHTGLDVVKAVLAGAHAVQVVSAVLEEGPEKIAVLRQELEAWLTAHEYASLREGQGSMGYTRCPDPTVYERLNYVKLLHGWR